MDYDYLVRYILDNRNRSEIIVAKCSEEARELFCRVHPTLTIVSVEFISDTDDLPSPSTIRETQRITGEEGTLKS